MTISKKEIDHILRGWHTLSVFMSENDSLEICEKLFETEIKNKKRNYLLTRLAAKIAKLTMIKKKGELNARIDQAYK